jgi:methyltransferase (TIGR00027 family)
VWIFCQVEAGGETLFFSSFVIITLRFIMMIRQVFIYLLIAAPRALCFASGGPPQGGAPPGVAGGPKVGGPPTGPPTGTAAPGGLETFFDRSWPILYAFDKEGKLRDSSKNLRVLWTRALLANLGKINDPIAYNLLPRGTRKIVGPLAARSLWSSPIGAAAVAKLDWIVDRTNFIDKTVQQFLEETPGPKQVIVLGAGYDTRSLRFQSSDIQFFEVDLPDIAIAKESLMTTTSLNSNTKKDIIQPKHFGFDLNTIATEQTSLVNNLVEKKGLDTEIPTMVICEAVLFYLMPEAAQGLVKELFALNAKRYCFTDNLAKLGVAPGPPVPTPKEKCQGWLEREGKTLMDHNAIWGGAIHFVSAK